MQNLHTHIQCMYNSLSIYMLCIDLFYQAVDVFVYNMHLVQQNTCIHVYTYSLYIIVSLCIHIYQYRSVALDCTCHFFFFLHVIVYKVHLVQQNTSIHVYTYGVCIIAYTYILVQVSCINLQMSFDTMYISFERIHTYVYIHMVYASLYIHLYQYRSDALACRCHLIHCISLSIEYIHMYTYVQYMYNSVYIYTSIDLLHQPGDVI